MVQVTSLDNDVWSVTPQGRIDSVGARTLEDTFAGLLAEGHARVVVDFSDVPYMASAGLRVLMIYLKRAKTMNGDVRLAAVNDRVRETLRLSGLDTLFTVHPTVDEAVQSLKG
jgi:anti-sigma B factor antagonist